MVMDLAFWEDIHMSSYIKFNTYINTHIERAFIFTVIWMIHWIMGKKNGFMGIFGMLIPINEYQRGDDHSLF